MSPTMVRDQRESFHNILTSIDGVKHVYFQPPQSKELKYPCIIYNMDSIDSKHADNKRYLSSIKFSVMLIDFDPESEIQKSILDLQGCIVDFNRFFTSDNLNHWTYDVYYSKQMW